MGLLDLSAAFDCVDHELLLLHRLRQNFGFSGEVFEWLTSFVIGRSGRTYQVAFNGQLSPVQLQPVLYGVPQGSCLGATALRTVHGRTQPGGRPASTDAAAPVYAYDCQIYDDKSPSDVLSGVEI